MRAGRVVRQALYSPRDPTTNTRRRAISISAEDKKRANLKTSYEKLLMLACANFLPGDWWVTLTYDDTFLPESREESRKYWRKSMRWYRKYRKDNKDALRYVYCTQLTTSRGGQRLHHHMILRYEDDMDQEKLESLWQWGMCICANSRTGTRFWTKSTTCAGNPASLGSTFPANRCGRQAGDLSGRRLPTQHLIPTRLISAFRQAVPL